MGYRFQVLAGAHIQNRVQQPHRRHGCASPSPSPSYNKFNDTCSCQLSIVCRSEVPYPRSHRWPSIDHIYPPSHTHILSPCVCVCVCVCLCVKTHQLQTLCTKRYVLPDKNKSHSLTAGGVPFPPKEQFTTLYAKEMLLNKTAGQPGMTYISVL